ncbi:MAG: cobalamin-dependent protein [Candidatus Bathyarchaeia archaeon]
MSVCLVYPDFAFSGNPPLGLAYIAAVIEKNGVKVDIVDCRFHSSVGKSVARILRDNPMIVGINAPTLLYPNALKIARGSLRNFSIKPMAQVLKLLSILTRKFLAHRSLRVPRYSETDTK